MGAPVTDMPAQTALQVGTSLRRRAVRADSQRAFNPEEMTRAELIRFCGALIAENQELRRYAEGKDAELLAGLDRARENVAAYKQSQDRWKTDYAFYLTLTRETIDHLIDLYQAGKVPRKVLEGLADAIAETCTLHTSANGKAKGGVTSWLTRAKRIWDAVDRGTLLDPERLK